MAVLSALRQTLHAQRESGVFRQRFIEQATLLHRLKYLKGPFRVPSAAFQDAQSFERFFSTLLKPSRFAKGWKLPVLHSFVLTLLIALGDDAKLRKKVGAALQQSEKQVKSLSRRFGKDAVFYGQYVSLIPPRSEAFSKRLLRLAA